MKIAVPNQTSDFHRTRGAFLSLASLLLCTGCSRNPSLEISGSFFPAWMLCIFLGLFATLVAKRLFLVSGIDPYLKPQLIVYGALMIGLTLLAWLVLYS
jgi:hypothetical protein